MSITASYSVHCDRCDAPLTAPDGNTGRHDSPVLAETAALAAGWAIARADGRRGRVELCPVCTPLGAPGGPIVHRLVQPPPGAPRGSFACACGALYNPGRIRGVPARALARCPRQVADPVGDPGLEKGD